MKQPGTIVYVFEGIEYIPDSTRRIYRLLGYEHTEQYDKLKRNVSLLKPLRTKMQMNFMLY